MAPNKLKTRNKLKAKKLAKKAAAPAIAYQRCIVTFLDVLGFKEIVRSRSVGDVHKIIKQLERFTRPVDIGDIEAPKEMSHVVVQSVSDAIVRARIFNTEYRDGAFFHELVDLLHAQIELVGLGVLVRGGVTVGEIFVGETGDATFFGPALIRAYEIESQEAIFPRIVVGEEALVEHRSNKALRSESNTLKYELEAIDKLLAVGEDGTRYINYLAAAESEIDEGGYPDFLHRHAELIRDGRVAASDLRVKRKFEWLARYHNATVVPMRDHVLSSKENRTVFEYAYDGEIDPDDFFSDVILD
jgi:hypothetical protein